MGAENMMLDTQVLSQLCRSKAKIDINNRISSTVAKELFGAYRKSDFRNDNFYVPFYSAASYSHRLASSVRKDAIRRIPQKRHADKAVVNFGGVFPDLVEYSNKSIALAINSKNEGALKWAISKQSKRKIVNILSQYRHIIQNDINCVAVTEEDFENAASILFQFTRRHNLKSNFRNSFNDLLILACTERLRHALATKDSLLHRYYVYKSAGRISENDNNIIIDFEGGAKKRKSNRRESKGYINKGWSIAIEQRAGLRS